MVDGRCAYTLLLPASGNEAMCPTDTTASQQVTQTLKEFELNITRLSQWYGENAHILNGVQANLFKQQTAINLIQSQLSNGIDRVTRAGNKEEVKGQDGDDNCAVCDAISTNVTEHAKSIQTLQMTLTSQEVTIQSLDKQVNTMVAQLPQLDKYQQQMENLTTMYNSLKAYSASLEAKLKNLASDKWLCSNRSSLTCGKVIKTTASSVYNDNLHPPSKARISSDGAWCPSEYQLKYTLSWQKRH